MGYNRQNFENYDCDRCKFKFTKSQLRLNKGLLVCPDCYDDISENKNISMKLALSPRGSSTTTTAVTTPTVFSITAAGGITPSHSTEGASSRSVTLDVGLSVSFGSSYYMKIVGDGGAINVTSVPQITAGNNGDSISLHGTSDSNTVTLENGDGVEVANGISFSIGNNDVITLVYDNVKSKWVETSRKENGGF